MKRIKNPIAILSLLAATFILSGCVTNRATGPYADAYERANPKQGVLGIVEQEKGSYAIVNPATFALSTEEVYPHNDISGDNVTWLWGLITVSDY